MSTRQGSGWVVLLAALATAATSGALAAPGKQAPPGGKRAPVAAVGSAEAAALSATIRGKDPEQTAGALAQAKSYGKGGGPLAPAIQDLLRQGTSPELTKQAIVVLADIGGAEGSAIVRPYTRHRQVAVRKDAVKALFKTGGPEAIAGLRDALSDADPAVRGLAASGLGALHAREALGDLFLALDHRIDDAAGAIGQICNPDECEKLAAKTGTGAVPFDVMTTGFDQILFRPTSEIPDAAKIKIIARLRELGTPEGGKYLRDVQSRWPADGSPAVKKAIAQAVNATAGVAPASSSGPGGNAPSGDAPAGTRSGGQ